MDQLGPACATLAPILSWVLAASSLPVVLKIRAEPSLTLSLPLLPYSTQAINAFVYCIFGYTTDNNVILASNAFGLALGLFYTATFLSAYYSQQQLTMKKNPSLPGTVGDHLYGGVAVALFAIILNVLLPPYFATQAVGILGAFLCTLMFASPLAALKEIVRKRDASIIQLPFVGVCFANTLVWIIYGEFVLGDRSIVFPNFIGFGLACANMALVVKFGRGRSAHSDKEDDCVDLELERSQSQPTDEIISLRSHEPSRIKKIHGNATLDRTPT